MLNDDTAQFGKSFLFDGNATTAWNSDDGTAHSITVKFSQPVRLAGLALTFQGGFSAADVTLTAGGPLPAAPGEPTKLHLRALGSFHAADTNSKQTLLLNKDSANSSASANDASVAVATDSAVAAPLVTVAKVALGSPADFHGRVVVYELVFLGSTEADATVGAQSNNQASQQ